MATLAFPTPRFQRDEPVVLPGDVRLMRATANALLAIGVLLVAAVALNWLVRQPVFSIRAIRVEGEVTRNSATTIRANAAPKLAGNFFTTDLQAGRRAFESVPWVRRAEVRRIWPNRLAVRLEEHRPVAVWGSDAATDRLVNSHGEVFEANVGDVEDDSLPTLDGPDGSAARMLEMLRALQPVFARLGGEVVALSLSGRGSWHVALDNGAEIEAGRGEPPEVVARAESFVSTITQVTQRFGRPLEYADLRHRDGYAVRLKGISTVITPATKAKN